MRRRVVRALSVEVTAKGFAFGVLEGAERLVEWGGREVQGDVSVFINRLGKVIERYRPDVLVLEDPAGSRKASRSRERLAWAEELAHKRGICCRPIPREAFVRVTRNYGPTKHDLAIGIARLFPELEPHLPRPRKPWESESRAVAVFVAVARGCEAIQKGGC